MSDLTPGYDGTDAKDELQQLRDLGDNPANRTGKHEFKRELNGKWLDALQKTLFLRELTTLTTDKIVELLEGASPEVAVTAATALHNDAIKYRVCYEACVDALPDEVESPVGPLPNHYATLGVPRNAKLWQVKKSYRLLSLAYSPDRFMREGDQAVASANEKMKQLNQAHDVLAVRPRRAEYDDLILNYTYQFPQRPWYSALVRVNLNLLKKVRRT